MKKFLFIICILILTCQTTYSTGNRIFFKQTSDPQIFAQRMSPQSQAEHQKELCFIKNHKPFISNRPDLAGFANKKKRRRANKEAKKEILKQVLQKAASPNAILTAAEKKLISYYKHKEQDRLEKINQLANKMLSAYLDSTKEFPNLTKKDPSIAHEVQRLFIEKVSAEQLKKMANAHTYVHYNLWK